MTGHSESEANESTHHLLMATMVMMAWSRLIIFATLVRNATHGAMTSGMKGYYAAGHKARLHAQRLWYARFRQSP